MGHEFVEQETSSLAEAESVFSWFQCFLFGVIHEFVEQETSSLAEAESVFSWFQCFLFSVIHEIITSTMNCLRSNLEKNAEKEIEL